MSCFSSPGYPAWFFHSVGIYIHQKSCKLSKCPTGHFLLCLSDLALPWHFLSLFLCLERLLCSPFFPSYIPAGHSYSAMRCPLQASLSAPESGTLPLMFHKTWYCILPKTLSSKHSRVFLKKPMKECQQFHVGRCSEGAELSLTFGG